MRLFLLILSWTFLLFTDDMRVLPCCGGYLCNGRCAYVNPWVAARNTILCGNLLTFLNCITKVCNENTPLQYSNTFSI